MTQPETQRVCRVCGCCEDDCRRCLLFDRQLCTWVEDDLCSACVPLPAERLRELKEQARKADPELMMIQSRELLILIDTAEACEGAGAGNLGWLAQAPFGGPEGLEPYQPFQVNRQTWAFCDHRGQMHAGFGDRAEAMGCADKVRAMPREPESNNE